MQAVTPVSAGAVSFGTGHPLAFVLGPCVIESEGHALEIGSAIAGIAKRIGVPVVFKASFDKANRTNRFGAPASTRACAFSARSKNEPACRS
jgi:2-dehydro-3-deoxyphosphooctonate aldolase (KDO 8-P synthase)